MSSTLAKFVLIGPIAAVAVALAGCGATSTPAAGTSSAGASSVGAPSTGASATSGAAGSPAVTSAASGEGGMPMPSRPVGPHNQVDITFAQEMIVHHQGAITMAELASTRASDAKVKELAAQIKAAQGPEITQMSGWLAAWAPATDMNGMPETSAAPTGMSGMGSGSAMPGMMSAGQMAQLSAASGAAFDKLFLQLMIVHHQGALTMSRTEKAGGSNPSALSLAGSIISSQTVQIAQMHDLLKGM